MNAARREEIEQLFLQNRRGVGSYAYARVGDADIAESITAKVFLLVVRRWDQCHTSRTAWLWAIVRNEIARHFRDRRDHEIVHDDIEDDAARPPDEVEQRETWKRMRDALDQLSDEHREIVYLKFFQQMRNKDIATATGRSADNIGVIVHRALQRLRQLMETSDSTISK